MNRIHIILIVILLIGLFFRTYGIIDRFGFAHDADLYSWIVKDIVVDKHLRLIGQLTSAPGIFIGPLFYYFLVPFFLLFNMDPIGSAMPITLVGLLTIFSYFFVLSKLYNKYVGLIAAFIYAASLYIVEFDRLVAPSTVSNLWVIWYFFAVVNITRGNFFVLPFIGLLLGLIWHIHIALLPALIAVPIAILLASKIPSAKQLLGFLMLFFLSSLPLIAFELRHNFSQTFAFFNNFYIPHGGETGIEKLFKVFNLITKNINSLFFAPFFLPITQNILFIFLLLSSGLFLIRKKLFPFKELVVFYAWILGVIIFYTFSSTLVSEYYLVNIEVIFTLLVSCLLYLVFKYSKLGQVLILILAFMIVSKNIYFLKHQDFYHKGYNERKAIVNLIASDVHSKGYPCIGITYITSPGENVGFRYFFWLANLKLKHPSEKVPVYNIILPDELSSDVQHKFGHIGLIIPNSTKLPAKEKIEKNCQGENTNLTDSMLGFTR